MSRAVVFTILLWTAADLSNVSLCALDNEDASATAALASADGVVLQAPSDAGVPLAPASHVDDCFCCSHCVEVAVIIPAQASAVASSPRPALVRAEPRIFGSPLYHPPKFSLQ